MNWKFRFITKSAVELMLCNFSFTIRYVLTTHLFHVKYIHFWIRFLNCPRYFSRFRLTKPKLYEFGIAHDTNIAASSTNCSTFKHLLLFVVEVVFLNLLLELLRSMQNILLNTKLPTNRNVCIKTGWSYLKKGTYAWEPRTRVCAQNLIITRDAQKTERHMNQLKRHALFRRLG